MLSKRKYSIMFWLLFIGVGAAFCALMFNNNVWYDEAYSLAMIEHSFGEIAKITVEDVHPPMYYYGLKIFVAVFGDSMIALKVFSLIPIMLILILGYYVIGKITDRLTGLLFCTFFVLMPVFTIYSVQLRMYSWSCFLVFACGVYAYRAVCENKISHWILFTAFGTLAAYTHYFALVSAGVIYALLLIACIRKHRLLKWLVFASLTVILYLPWLASFVAQLRYKVENEYWIAPITISTIGEYFKVWYNCGSYTTLYLIGSVIVYVLAAVGLITMTDKKIRFGTLSAIGVFVFTVVLGVGASIVVRPVFIERYAIPALTFIPLFAAVGIRSLNRKSISIAVAVFYITGFVLNYPTDYKTEYGETDAKTGEYINSNGFDAVVCYVNSQLYGVLAYYAPDIPVYRPKVSIGSPFTNIYPLSEMDIDSCNRAALYVPDGTAIPDEMAQIFTDIIYDGDCITYGQKSNVYVMSK